MRSSPDSLESTAIQGFKALQRLIKRSDPKNPPHPELIRAFIDLYDKLNGESKAEISLRQIRSVAEDLANLRTELNLQTKEPAWR
jgi:hypothetical protein